jgi:hypothetical protein
MPLGFGAFFSPSGKIRGGVRYKIAEVFHCEGYYPAKNVPEFKYFQQKLEKYHQKASRQRAVEVAENRCT